MRFPISILMLALAFPISLPAQNPKPGSATPGPDSWEQLVTDERYREAHTLCDAWLEHEDPVYRSAAHKCIANLVLLEGAPPVDDGRELGDGIQSTYSPEAADSALYHLNVAMRLTPNDLSIHQGRIHILTLAGMHDQTPAALEESFEIYRGEHDPDDWLNFSLRMYNARAYDAGLDYTLVLEKQFPEEHRVVANVGTFLSMLERDDEAIEYARRAVEMEPEDAINNWNLARLYMYRNHVDEADHYYLRAMELDPENAELRCTYADFIDGKLGDVERACNIRKLYCEDIYEERCGGKK